MKDSMNQREAASERFSPWWRYGVLIVFIVGFGVLIWVSATAYKVAPPIPDRVVDPGGAVVFTGDDILSGQEVFLKHGLMDNGTLWGHGAYLGPDFSATYLHNLVVHAQEAMPGQNSLAVGRLLSENRYDTQSHTLRFTVYEADSYQKQVPWWNSFFLSSETTRGLLPAAISNPQEVRQLVAFFAWAAWASAAHVPGRAFSYTNNFPYDPQADNGPSADALLWSALSLIALLAGTAAVLFAFGKFDYLGWHGDPSRKDAFAMPTGVTPAQRATLKFFVIVPLLLLAQTLVGGALAHFRADPESFYGLDLAALLPSNLLRTWHLQTAIFWIATAYVGGGLFLASALGGKDPKRQVMLINVLFGALLVVVAGQPAGRAAGHAAASEQGLVLVRAPGLGVPGAGPGMAGRPGHRPAALGVPDAARAGQGARRQGPEGAQPALPGRRRSPSRSSTCRPSSSAAPPISPWWTPGASGSSISGWRASSSCSPPRWWRCCSTSCDMVSRQTATRVIYLDAILFLGAGIIGTGHHWYWTGQTTISMALSSTFSAMEVVPLILLTLDAAGLHAVSRGRTSDASQRREYLPHRWTFYFLIAVGVWNFIGAGVFGFLINLPIVSYYEVGTNLTANHGHAAMMGVFGMLALAFVVFALRQSSDDAHWQQDREVRAGLLLGPEHRPGRHGRAQPLPQRRPAGPGRGEQRLLARAIRRRSWTSR